MQRLDGRDGRCRVPRGVLAEHRQEQVVVGSVDAAYPQRLSAHRPQPLLDLEIAVLELQLRADVRAPPLDHTQRLDILLPADRDSALLDDARLLPRHLGDGRPELRMVEGDRGEDGDVATDQVRGIPRPAHAHLEHAERDRLVREPQVGQRGERLEVGDLILALRIHEQQVRQQVLVLLGELLLRDVDAADREPLADRHQMGGGVEPGGQPVRARQLRRHAGGRALAVRAGDVDRWVRQLRVGQQRGEREDPREVGQHAALSASFELGDGLADVQPDQPPSSASCAIDLGRSLRTAWRASPAPLATTSSAAFARKPSFCELRARARQQRSHLVALLDQACGARPSCRRARAAGGRSRR